MKIADRVVIFFRLIPLVFILFLGITGCAGPIMHTIPTKPEVTESDSDEIKQAVIPEYEVIMGENFKYNLYLKITWRNKDKNETGYVTGYITVLNENVTSTKDITVRLLWEIVGGVIGKPINKAKTNTTCTQVVSKEGKILSSDCGVIDNTPISKPPPTHILQTGNQWSKINDLYFEHIGMKIPILTYYRLDKFTLIDKRPCAKIEFEANIDKEIQFPSRDLLKYNYIKHRGVIYYDLKLGIFSFGKMYMDVKGIYKTEDMYLNSELILKLDYENSVFKRPIISPIEKPFKPEAELPAQKLGDIPKLQESIPTLPSIKGDIFIVTGTFANIRSGAGEEFSIVTTVKQGDKLTLLGEHGEWFHVRLEKGQEGWISNKFVK